MSTPSTITVAVTQEHIQNGTTGRDPIELAVIKAIPGAVNARAWFLDAEAREMSATVWLAGDDFLAPSLVATFTLPPEAFEFLNDFVDGEPVSPFTFTAQVRAA